MLSNTPLERRTLLTAGGALIVGGAAFMAWPGEAAPERFAISFSAEQWRAKLGPQRFAVLRQESTEQPFTSPLLREHRRGTFLCAGCALPLFASSAKFDSGTGWPSFTAALPNAVAYKRDLSLGMLRTEEHCRRCGGHLGHVFDDGPQPTGKRHCINGLSLTFRPA